MDQRQIAELKRTIDLVALAEKAGARLKQHGREWRGTCPLHQGANPTAFVIRNGEHGQWWQCYTGCGQGDAIKFVMMAYHLNFKDALKRLGVMDFPKRDPVVVSKRDDCPPPKTWQTRAWELISQAEDALWSPGGERARAWLHQRGLRDETIRRWQLGLNERNSYDAPDRWGLDEERQIWIPRGITIPTIFDMQIFSLNIRRPQGQPKYYKIIGSCEGLFGTLHQHGICVLTEGEFDAMLLRQEAGDLVDVATMGAAGHLPKGRWQTLLLAKRSIVVVVDNDDAGHQAIKAWQGFSRRVRIIQPLEGKDITDFWQLGGNLRAWVQFILSSLELARLGPVTNSPVQPSGPNEVTSDGESRLTEPGPVCERVKLDDLVDGYLEKSGLRIVGGRNDVWPPVIYTEEVTHE